MLYNSFLRLKKKALQSYITCQKKNNGQQGLSSRRLNLWTKINCSNNNIKAIISFKHISKRELLSNLSDEIT